MTRWKAFAIHLALSALVFSIIAAVLVWRWYPPGLMALSAADTLLAIIAGVHLGVGPLITLAVYKHGKKGMKFDLVVIALLQAGALAFGLYTAWSTRPVFLVASDTRLTLVHANEIEKEDLAAAPAAYRRLPAWGPRTVAMTMPDDIADTMLMMVGEDPHRLPAKYREYGQVLPRLLANAVPVEDLPAALAPRDRDRLASAVRATGRPAQSLGAVPVRSIRGRATMLLDIRSGELLKPVAIRMPAPSKSGPAETTGETGDAASTPANGVTPGRTPPQPPDDVRKTTPEADSAHSE